ncbi:MAG: hypothetical protein ACM3TT_00055 [Syntrophothermus sp.]
MDLPGAPGAAFQRHSAGHKEIAAAGEKDQGGNGKVDWQEEYIKKLNDDISEVKTNLRGFRGEFKEEFKGIRTEMNEKFEGVRAEFKEEFKGIRTEMNEKFEGIHAEMDGGFRDIRTEMNEKFEGIHAETNEEFRGIRAEINEIKRDTGVLVRWGVSLAISLMVTMIAGFLGTIAAILKH